MKRRIIASGPNQPDGPFPKDEKQGRSFSNSYYSFTTKAGLKLYRHWLCYSEKLDCVYCQPCWLFPQQQDTHGNPTIKFRTSGIRDWKHISERILSHEGSIIHARACVVYEQWRKHRTIDVTVDKRLEEEKNFWRKVLERILNVTLTLATCNLAFRGTNEKFEHNNKGNFLSIIELLSKYDPILHELLLHPQGSVKYLSPKSKMNLLICYRRKLKMKSFMTFKRPHFFLSFWTQPKMFQKLTN